MREFAKAFYHSKEWLKCRAAYIAQRRAIDGGMCESCHEKPGYIVHHKIELTPENIHDPYIALSFSNLKYDCHECHNAEHEFGFRNTNAADVPGRVALTFGADGQPVPTPPLK